VKCRRPHAGTRSNVGDAVVAGSRRGRNFAAITTNVDWIAEVPLPIDHAYPSDLAALVLRRCDEAAATGRCDLSRPDAAALTAVVSAYDSLAPVVSQDGGLRLIRWHVDAVTYREQQAIGPWDM
jgi:hypothetical protein